MTKEEESVLQIWKAYQYLSSLGWVEPRHFKFPEDGKKFQLIEVASSGIHTAIRRKGYIFVDNEWPSIPILVRHIKEAK